MSQDSVAALETENMFVFPVILKPSWTFHWTCYLINSSDTVSPQHQFPTLETLTQFCHFYSTHPCCLSLASLSRDFHLILLLPVSPVWVRRAGEERVSRLRQRQRRPRGAEAGLCWRADGRRPPQEVSTSPTVLQDAEDTRLQSLSRCPSSLHLHSFIKTQHETTQKSSSCKQTQYNMICPHFNSFIHLWSFSSPLPRLVKLLQSFLSANRKILFLLTSAYIMAD